MPSSPFRNAAEFPLPISFFIFWQTPLIKGRLALAPLNCSVTQFRSSNRYEASYISCKQHEPVRCSSSVSCSASLKPWVYTWLYQFYHNTYVYWFVPEAIPFRDKTLDGTPSPSSTRILSFFFLVCMCLVETSKSYSYSNAIIRNTQNRLVLTLLTVWYQ